MDHYEQRIAYMPGAAFAECSCGYRSEALNRKTGSPLESMKNVRADVRQHISKERARAASAALLNEQVEYRPKDAA